MDGKAIPILMTSTSNAINCVVDIYGPSNIKKRHCLKI